MMIHSIYSDKIEVREDSVINGSGSFAKKRISKGEILFVKGGHILTRKTMFSAAAIDSYWPISDDIVLAANNAEEATAIKLRINHSCDPNCGIRGDIVGVAIRGIDKGEEIVFDYAMLDNEQNWFECNCGGKNCRKILSSYDWKIKELQEKYSEYFIAYLKEKIKSGEYYQVFKDMRDDIYEFRKEVFVDEQKTRIKNEFEGNENKYTHCCLYRDNSLVSYARVGVHNKIARIGRVAVKQEMRKNGLGREIMFWAELESRKMGCSIVEIHAQLQAKKFYELIGYRPFGDVFFEVGIKHVMMTKQL